MKKVYVILAIAALVLCTSCGNNKKKSCDCNCEECKDTCTCKNAEEAVKEAAEAVQEAAEAVEEAAEKAAE